VREEHFDLSEPLLMIQMSKVGAAQFERAKDNLSLGIPVEPTSRNDNG
jgi:hypothetical protein